MKLINKIYDSRIRSYNLLFEISIGEYNNIATEIISNNEFQRRRVKSSSTVYSLLKKDLLEGCIIPPIVLAFSDQELNYQENHKEEYIIQQILTNQNKLIILDGLQRTYTIRDLHRQLESPDLADDLKKLQNQKIRIEIYVGINKIGILYRMLTLNTGQTPMSIRHQIEILYSDYLEQDLEGIKLIVESADRPIRNEKEYKFKEIVEGFNSYLDRDYLPMDRNSLLENIESLEKLSTENQDTDLFLSYMKTFDSFISTMKVKAENWEFDENALETKLSGQPFGKTVDKLFNRPQSMTGFGSAIGKLIDFNIYSTISDIDPLLENIRLEDIDSTLTNYVIKMDHIRKVAKKIGNDQRMFLHHMFRELFDKKGDAYLDLNSSIEEAYSSYLRKTQ